MRRTRWLARTLWTVSRGGERDCSSLADSGPGFRRCCQLRRLNLFGSTRYGGLHNTELEKCWVQGAASFSTASETATKKETISVTFVDKHGDEKKVQVPVGMSMLEAAHENDIELEGACEGSLACSTCHVIVMDDKHYQMLPEPSDEENDMLDLAFGLCETSRLGCQVKAQPELDGIRLAIPAATRNFAVDGHVPKPH